MPDLSAIYAKMREWTSHGRRSVKIEVSTQEILPSMSGGTPVLRIYAYDYNMMAGCSINDWAEFEDSVVEERLRRSLQMDLEQAQRRLAAMEKAAAAPVAQ